MNSYYIPPDGFFIGDFEVKYEADNDKKYISMQSLENHLIDVENGIIKLLDPPFENGKLEPGYIKSYLPGVRENGGQYTHECCC